jgi:DNA (cytosine-5)-methyltransferase 1
MVGAIDICPIATQTYTQNFPAARVETARLEEVDITALRHRLGTVDILLASPECTNHTCAKG